MIGHSASIRRSTIIRCRDILYRPPLYLCFSRNSGPSGAARSEIKLFHVFHIFDHHQRDLESNGILKNAQIETGALLQLVQPVHQSVSVDKKLT